MSTCASTSSVLPPAARGSAVNVSRPGEKSPSTSLISAPSGRSWMSSVPSRLNSGTSISQPTVGSPTPAFASVGANQRRDDFAVAARIEQDALDAAGAAAHDCGGAHVGRSRRGWPVDQHDVGRAVGGQRRGQQRGTSASPTRTATTPGTTTGARVADGGGGRECQRRRRKAAGSASRRLPATSNRAPASTPRRMRSALLLYEHAGRDALRLRRTACARRLQLRRRKLDLLLRPFGQVVETNADVAAVAGRGARPCRAGAAAFRLAT